MSKTDNLAGNPSISITGKAFPAFLSAIKKPANAAFNLEKATLHEIFFRLDDIF